MSGQAAPQQLPQADGAHLIALFNAGQYGELESRARQLSQQYPASGFVWKVLGTALLVQNKDGLHALERAVSLLPADVEARSNLGNVQKAQGRLAEAAASYQRAIAIRPDYVAGHYNLGLALKDLQQLDQAAAAFEQALALLPGFVDAHYNLANVYKDLGQSARAIQAYQQAIALQPDHAEAHGNLGVVLELLGRHDDAQASYRRALALQPNLAEVHNNLGNVLKELGRYDDALSCYQRALAIRPDMADAHNNLGNALKDLGRLDEALECYQRALAIRPDYTEALGNLLFTSNYLSGQAPQALLALAHRYGDCVAALARPYCDWPQARDPDRPLRVGLVSGDLCQHPVGYFVESVLEALKAQAGERIQVLAYATQVRHDAWSDRIRAACQGWCLTVGLSDEALAQRIRADGIDILIDLSGHTAHNRLPMFAWKPAPVQVSWLGYFATTGVAGIDYVLADPWTAPESTQAHFTEQLWRLPQTRWCFTAPDVDVPVTPLPASRSGHVTFACFNNLTKMNVAVVALWARVLRAVPGSRLMLKAEQLDDASVRSTVLAAFAAQGVGADRLDLHGRSDRLTYLRAYQMVDISLDPFPFTGGTTSIESLWMGVPVLTLAGDRLVSRQGVGLMMNAGLPDWVAQDADDYVAKAVAHAADLQALAACRAGLRQRVLASPLFDAAAFATHFEAALRAMWQRWCAKP